MLRPENKIVALMKDPVRRFQKPGDLVLDPFVVTLSTAKAFLCWTSREKFWDATRTVVGWEC